MFSIFDDVILVYFSCVLIHTCTWAFILGTSFWWLFMSKGNYGYYQKVHKILFMPSSIMFMLKCNSIHYHREHKKRLLPISNYDFTLMLISDLIKIYVKVGSPLQQFPFRSHSQMTSPTPGSLSSGQLFIFFFWSLQGLLEFDFQPISDKLGLGALFHSV